MRKEYDLSVTAAKVAPIFFTGSVIVIWFPWV